jgi:hypothetical protein
VRPAASAATSHARSLSASAAYGCEANASKRPPVSGKPLWESKSVMDEVEDLTSSSRCIRQLRWTASQASSSVARESVERADSAANELSEASVILCRDLACPVPAMHANTKATAIATILTCLRGPRPIVTLLRHRSSCDPSMVLPPAAASKHDFH